jgi:hypothetical protein
MTMNLEKTVTSRTLVALNGPTNVNALINLAPEGATIFAEPEMAPCDSWEEQAMPVRAQRASKVYRVCDMIRSMAWVPCVRRRR